MAEEDSAIAEIRACNQRAREFLDAREPSVAQKQFFAERQLALEQKARAHAQALAQKAADQSPKRNLVRPDFSAMRARALLSSASKIPFMMMDGVPTSSYLNIH